MKKVVFALMVFTVLSTQAQGKKMDLTPEQSATLKTKEMTLHLELNDKQQKQIHAMLLSKAEERASKRMTKEERKEMTDEQRYQAKIDRLDNQIAFQNDMRSILDDEQFTSWKESHEKRMKMMQRKKGKHQEKSKGKERKRE